GGAGPLARGYGRIAAGSPGNGVGVNASVVRSARAPSGAPVSVSRTGRRYRLVVTQEHHALEGTGERRHIVRAGTLAEVRAHPDHPGFVHPVEHHAADLYPDFEYEGYTWGMGIDQTDRKSVV